MKHRTEEQKRAGLEHLLKGCPDVLTPIGVARRTHQSKNTVYELIKTGELTAYPYRGKLLISKADLIDYMAEHSDDETGKFGIGDGYGE